MVTIHVLANIWRSKENRTMKFGHLIEYNTRNTFLEKSYTYCRGKTTSRTFSKKSKSKYISGSTVRNCIQFVLIVCRSRGLPNYIETKVCWPFTSFYLLLNFYEKQKRSGTSFPASFSLWLLKTGKISFVWLSFIFYNIKFKIMKYKKKAK